MSESKGHAGKEYQRTRTGGQVAALLYKICAGDITVLESVEKLDGNLTPEVVEVIKNNRLPFSGDLPIWGTITNGTGPKTSKGFQKKLEEVGISYSNWGKDILFQPDFESSISSKKRQIDLCVLKTEDILGEKGKSGTTQDIYTGIEKLGGYLLTAESGLNILLQLGHQLKNGEWILVAMKPIKGSDGDLDVFYVERDDDGDLWLYAAYDHPGSFWSPDNRWVFAARK